MSHKYHPSQQDKQPAHTGKAANDTNKVGMEKPTQKNEGRRTTRSRNDRESSLGGSNESQSRRGLKR